MVGRHGGIKPAGNRVYMSRVNSVAAPPGASTSLSNVGHAMHISWMDPAPLLLKHASDSRPSGQWSDDDYDVLADDVVVGRIFKANVFVARPWMFDLSAS